MKVTVNGKRYNSESCEILGGYDHHSSSNNYSGTTSLLRAKDGIFLSYTNANGQDLYLSDELIVVEDGDLQALVEAIEPDENEEARLVELGLLRLV